MIVIEKGIWHGDTMAEKSLLPYPYTFIYPQDYINIGGIMTKVKRICEQCEKTFYMIPSEIRKGRGRFCSKNCWGKWVSENIRGKDSHGWKGGKVTRICKQCKKEFETYPCEIEQGKGNFCSQKCFHVWQKGEKHPRWKGGEIKRICKQCEKEFFIKPCERKKGKERGSFCSRECRRKWQAENEEWLKHLEEMRKKISIKPTNPELIFQEICERNNLDFHYVGDGLLWIGKEKKLNPDFIEANGKKICVEVMGAYWHSPLLNRKVRETATLEYRKRHFKRFKWQPIFIWDTDLLREDAEQFVLKTLEEELK